MDKKEREAQLITENTEGLQAEQLINHPVFKEAIEEIESSYIDAIRSGNWFKKRAREENCRRLQMLDDLVTVINNKIIMGEEARKRLEASNGNKQR